jgi:hypothetical protein
MRILLDQLPLGLDARDRAHAVIKAMATKLL